MQSLNPSQKLYADMCDLFFNENPENHTILFIQRRAWAGSMTSSPLRSLCWRIFLGILPLERTEWAAQLQKQTFLYLAFKEENLPKMDKVSTDPLSALSGGDIESEEWKMYYKDIELSNLINGDLDRLYMTGIEDNYFQSDERRRMLWSILFLWSVRHRKLSYRQGMHEIVGPILYCLECEREAWVSAIASGEIDPSSDLYLTFTSESVEAHTYWIFERIMSELQILYDPMPKLNGRESHAHPEIVNFCTKVQEHFLRDLDPYLCTHLEESYVQAQLYGMRWSRLMFGREFPMTHSHCFRMWDYMFACCVGHKPEPPTDFHRLTEEADDVISNPALTQSREGHSSSSTTGVGSLKGRDEVVPLEEVDLGDLAPSDPPSDPLIDPLSSGQLDPLTTLISQPEEEKTLQNPSTKEKGKGKAVLEVHVDQGDLDPEALGLRSRRQVYTPLITAIGDFMLAMLLQIREDLVESDSNMVMCLLMRYPQLDDITPVLDLADMIRRGVLRQGAHMGASISPTTSSVPSSRAPPAWLSVTASIRPALSGVGAASKRMSQQLLQGARALKRDPNTNTSTNTNPSTSNADSANTGSSSAEKPKPPSSSSSSASSFSMSLSRPFGISIAAPKSDGPEGKKSSVWEDPLLLGISSDPIFSDKSTSGAGAPNGGSDSLFADLAASAASTQTSLWATATSLTSSSSSSVFPSDPLEALLGPAPAPSRAPAAPHYTSTSSTSSFSSLFFPPSAEAVAPSPSKATKVAKEVKPAPVLAPIPASTPGSAPAPAPAPTTQSLVSDRLLDVAELLTRPIAALPIGDRLALLAAPSSPALLAAEEDNRKREVVARLRLLAEVLTGLSTVDEYDGRYPALAPGAGAGGRGGMGRGEGEVLKESEAPASPGLDIDGGDVPLVAMSPNPRPPAPAPRVVPTEASKSRSLSLLEDLIR